MICARRTVLAGAAAAAAGLLLRPAAAVAGTATIHMMSSPDGGRVWFDPVGLWLPPGTRVIWSNGRDQANTHTATAYHPANGHHPLRIPEAVAPWDSGYLLPGRSFAVTLAVEGVYDYFCRPHEMAGMVGRIVIGQPGGPGAMPFDWGVAQHPDWLPVPPEAQRAFPSVDAIMKEKVVRSAG